MRVILKSGMVLMAGSLTAFGATDLGEKAYCCARSAGGVLTHYVLTRWRFARWRKLVYNVEKQTRSLSS